MFFCNFRDGGVFNQSVHFFPRIVNVVLVSKGRVSSDFDALLFMPVEEGLLLQVGVRFKLVDCGFGFGYFEEVFEFFFGEV